MSIETGLKGKVVIVTGAAAGIGRATALAFAREGARIAAWDVSDAKAAELVGELQAAGGEGLFTKVDVADGAAVSKAVGEVTSRWGRVDVLVNNAGIVRDAQLVKYKDGAVVSTMSDETWDAVINVNLKGVFLCTRAVAPHMKARGEGAIVNVSSTAGLRGTGSSIAYAVSKAGLNVLTQSLARVLAPEIRVNAVCPGFIQGRWLKSALGDAYEDHKAHWEKNSPLGKAATPEEVAAVILWLIESAVLITGQTIVADAGMTLGPAGTGVMGKRR